MQYLCIKMTATRNTVSKQHVMQLLQDAKGPLALSDIQQRSEGVCDRVTVYRILDRLLQDGQVHKSVSGQGVTHFAWCKTCDHGDRHDHHHIHFHCDECGEVVCLDHVIPEFKLPRKYKMREVNFSVSGVCPQCG
jgi:Fur family ferric uptake transcriptional regulator